MREERSLTRLTLRPGRLLVALALGLLLAVGSAAPPAPAATAAPDAKLVCQMKPSGRKGWLCWCYGTRGWRTAPKIMCQVAR